MMKLIKEIRSKEGALHFRRYELFSCKWFNVYIHKIYLDDKDDAHDHPWDFFSVILWGALIEDGVDGETTGVRSIGSCRFMKTTEFHKNRIISPVTSFVITGKRKHDWGYMTDHGWVGAEKYREEKHLTDHNGNT